MPRRVLDEQLGASQAHMRDHRRPASRPARFEAPPGGRRRCARPRERAREALFDILAHGRLRRAPGLRRMRACSTPLPAPARSGSRRCRAARASRLSWRATAPRAPRSSRNIAASGETRALPRCLPPTRSSRRAPPARAISCFSIRPIDETSPRRARGARCCRLARGRRARRRGAAGAKRRSTPRRLRAARRAPLRRARIVFLRRESDGFRAMSGRRRRR